MKTLCLIRHAKSSWNHPEINDIDRPLELRGEEDAVVVGKWLYEQTFKPDIILSSPANRAINTAKILAAQLHYDTESIIIEPSVYEASVEDLLAVIKNVDDKYSTLLLVGHNPGLTWLANYLAEDHMINLHTCGVYCITFETSTWQDITDADSKHVFSDEPKQHYTETTVWHAIGENTHKENAE
ncbi:histidine phosphatase family protein [soil metagenome]